MPHPYELHTDVLAPCACCRSEQPFRFTSAADQVVCGFCRHHLGESKAARRDGDHIALWRAQYTREVEAHAGDVAAAAASAETGSATIDALAAQVGQLTAVASGVFDETLVGGIRDVLENDLLRRAERRTELVTRRLDQSLAALAEVELLHHDAAAGQCSCGRSVMRCGEYRAVEPQRAGLRDWRLRQRD